MSAPLLLAGAVHEEIFPLPEVAGFTAEFEFVQENTAPAGVLTNAAGETVSPAHTDRSDSAFTAGVGFTATLKEVDEPEHPLRLAVTVITPVTEEPEVFAGALHTGIFPAPEAPRFMDVLLLLQLKVAPAGVLENAGTVIFSPGQTEMSVIAVTVGLGFTVMVMVFELAEPQSTLVTTRRYKVVVVKAAGS